MSKSFRPNQQIAERDADNPYQAKPHRAAIQKPKKATCKPLPYSETQRLIAKMAHAGYGLVDRDCYDFKYRTPSRGVDAHAEHVQARLDRINAERAAVAEAA